MPPSLLPEHVVAQVRRAESLVHDRVGQKGAVVTDSGSPSLANREGEVRSSAGCEELWCP